MEYNVGDIITGVVTGIENYGIFISLENSFSGLIHISEISSGYVKEVSDYVNIGETIYCKILEVDLENKHIKLSIKDINYKTDGSKKREVELKEGFNILKEHLPIWTEEKLAEYDEI